jgi:hypothetical protein
MGDKQVILSVFGDEAAADAAVDALKVWDTASEEIKLNAIGVLVLDDTGKIKAQKLGKRSVGKGAGIGIILALLTPVGIGAVLVGGVLGAFHHKGLGMSEEDRARIGKELEGGKAAVGVLASPAEASIIAAKLTELGGTTESHDVTDEALEAAAVSVDVAPEATPVPTA